VTIAPTRGAAEVPLRFRWATTRTALWVGGGAVFLAVIGVPLSILSHTISQNVLVVPFGIVGYVIARRQPQNPCGWLLLGIAVALTVAADAGQYALLDYRLGHTGLPLSRLAVFVAAGWVWLIIFLPLPIALFPDGRLSRPWRLVLWVYLLDGSVFLAVFGWEDITGVLAPKIAVDSSGELARFGGSANGGAVALTENVVLVVYVAISLSWVVRQIWAYRGSTGDRRAQLKWLMAGGAFSVATLVASLIFGNVSSPIVRALVSIGFVGIVALPISIGIAILKYRLYDIDRLVSRTLSYAIVTGLLVGVYVAMIALTTKLIPLSSSVGVAASTLAAVGLFAPLRRRVQHAVDRRFNRARYDTDAMVAAFTARLRDAVQLDAVRGDLLNVVNAAVEPSQASLWIRPMSRVS
jgi:hypothetical protein